MYPFRLEYISFEKSVYTWYRLPVVSQSHPVRFTPTLERSFHTQILLFVILCIFEVPRLTLLINFTVIRVILGC